jgi:hypothetical protein
MKNWICQSILEVDKSKAPVFFCPWEWKWAKLLGALKVFPSVGEAKRNGWDRDIPWGLEDAVVRVRKQRGILTVFKPREETFTPGYWARTQEEFARDDD